MSSGVAGQSRSLIAKVWRNLLRQIGNQEATKHLTNQESKNAGKIEFLVSWLPDKSLPLFLLS